jgi:hypothetical protein
MSPGLKTTPGLKSIGLKNIGPKNIGLNLLVFREGRRMVSGKELKSALFRQLEYLTQTASPESGPQEARFKNETLKALLHAGELECAAGDAGLPPHLFEALTDILAEALLSDHVTNSLRTNAKLKELKTSLEAVSLPNTVSVSTPEGFAYYGLHPLAFADVLNKAKVTPFPQRVAVIGIRTIGTTLSAICSAATRKRGVHAGRITVRPTGHPYDRRTEFSPEQLAFVRQEIAAGADFSIVDEGPGLSGSSLLSVGEALVQAGVAGDKITFICSHEPDVEALCAPDGPRRWRSFRSIAAAAGAQIRKPADAQVWIGAGEWRRLLLSQGSVSQASCWPASWTSLERPKYVSGSAVAASSGVTESRFFKFLGLGHYGERVFEREARVAAAGFAPPPRIESDGYVSYPLISGRPMRAEDLTESVLARMAAYCAFRLQHFSAEPSHLDSLQQMAEHNLKELRFEIPVKLAMERPVLTDARMQPHEWLLTSSGQVLKTDSGGHGDDHFFPGVTDIAWDLAGAVVEWKMEAEQAATFLEMYRRASGDNAAPRIAEFIKAYAVFRCAYCMMAANATQDAEEQWRLEQAAANYGGRLESKITELLPQRTPRPQRKTSFAADFADTRKIETPESKTS